MEETLLHESLQLRDPVRLLQQVLRQWERWNRGDLWIFGYASLIWRPEFESDEHRPAQVHGYHRALRMRSRINRGTPERPGLVYALVPGGCCRGVAYRLAAARVEEELPRLWAREMPTGTYDPRWLKCQTPAGAIRALAFTLSRRSPSYTGRLTEEEVLEVLRHARGRYGSTLDYLLHTATALRHHGMPDRESERLLELARRHQLLQES
jgi:cation transport protein ChaC